MSLPSDFISSAEYFEAAMCFLKENSWIYKSSNTNFIVENILDEFPADWKEYFLNICNEDLNLFPENTNQDPVPKSLKEFQLKLKTLTPKHNLSNFNDKTIYFRKMNPKKLHEISRLSEIIENICKDDIDILIDFGSGLGYLSEILYKNKNYNIIGLECDNERIKTAIKRQEQYYPTSKQQIFYENHMITESSNKYILDIVNQLFPDIFNPRIAIIGLHSCADLTITSIKLYLQMTNVKKLIIMPCCYHKLELQQRQDNCGNNKFKNFPLNKSLSLVVQKYSENGCVDEFLNRPFLRLASQQTASRWKNQSENDHFQHGSEMFIRGVLQSIFKDDNQSVRKIKCESLLIKPTDYLNRIHLYSQIQKQYMITTVKKNDNSGNKCNSLWTEQHWQDFNQILLKYPETEGCRLCEGLTCLQTSLQELCENIVLYDRICYINEHTDETEHNNVLTAYIQKIMDDKLSPRCYALISLKK